MARAQRHYLPGHVWHLTHRCHKKEFLLKFSRDRCRWVEWLFESKKRYGLKVLNYIVTSNHIHLLVLDGTKRPVIPDSKLRRSTTCGKKEKVHFGKTDTMQPQLNAIPT